MTTDRDALTPRTAAGKRLLAEYRDFVAEARQWLGAIKVAEAITTLEGAILAIEAEALDITRDLHGRCCECFDAPNMAAGHEHWGDEV